MSKVNFDFAHAAAPSSRSAVLSKAFTEAWCSGMSNSAIAVAMHRSHSAVKSVSVVKTKSDEPVSETIHVKFFDGETMTFHFYTQPAPHLDMPLSWEIKVDVKDDTVTLH